MKKLLGACLLASMTLFLFGALAVTAAPPPHHGAAATAGSPKAVAGEIVDLSCYLGHGSKGPAHKECAATCIANGGPMGLLTDKGLLYVLTMNHDNADAFNAAKKHAGDKVKITGPITVKNNTRALEVNGVETI